MKKNAYKIIIYIKILAKSVRIFFNEKRIEKILFIGFSFFLINYVGGKLTEKAQRNFSDYEHDKITRESEVKAATKVFEEVSRLMDKRIYRMEKLNWELKDNKEAEKIDYSMIEYRKTLYDWNDNRNRNIALMDRYFGKKVAFYFDSDVHAAIKETGKNLENYYYMPKYKRNESIGWELDGKLGDLENKAKKLNLMMLEMIQNQKVGIYNPDVQ